MFLKNFFLVFLFFLNFGSTYSYEIKSAEIPFKKIVRENDIEIENVEGVIYFTGEEKIFIKVTKPLNQIVIFAKFTNFFYYPDENSAIIMTYKTPNISAIKMQFDIFTRDDMGLGEAGYELESSYKSNKILISVWKPPEKFKRQLGKIEIGQTRMGIVFSRVFSPGGGLFVFTEFIDFTEIRGRKIPVHIKSTYFLGKKKHEEELIYYSPKVDVKIAEEIVNFAIPENAKIKIVEW